MARRAGLVALALVMLVVGVGGIVAFLVERDDATIVDADAPGVLAPGETSPILEKGNLRITHRDPAISDELWALAEEIAGEPTPALIDAGQAIIVEQGGEGIVARAHKRRLRVDDPSDPRLRTFLEFWLGRGAG